MERDSKRVVSTSVVVTILGLTMLVCMATAPLSWASDHNEAPFPVARLFFQLNDTDSDLGIHLLVDGEPWTLLEIDNPQDQRILSVHTAGKLRKQGLTEFKFESAEPDFDEFPAEKFFQRFPEGVYDIEAKRQDGSEYESEVVITHLLPAPPQGLTVNGEETPEDCDEGPIPVISGPFIISWDPVELSHPEIGAPNNAPIQVVRYEVAVERDEPFFKMDTTIEAPEPPGVPATSYEVPASLFTSGDLVKFQVLVQGGDDTGTENETSSESCFMVK